VPLPTSLRRSRATSASTVRMSTSAWRLLTTSIR
jgi:hypothetical protein